MTAEMTVLCDVTSAVPGLTPTSGKPVVRFTLEGVGQPGIRLRTFVVCTEETARIVKEVLVAVDHLVDGDYHAEDLAAAALGRRVRVELTIDVYKYRGRLSVRRWLPPPPDPGDPGRTRYYRGACVHGHEFYGAITGPTTPAQLFVPCPLDGVLGCGQTELRAAE